MNSNFRQLPPEQLDELVMRVTQRIGAKIPYALLSLCRNCPMCDNWNPDGELCKLANARPPATVIAFGCEAFKSTMGNYGTSGT
jgi:hypothetical protein